MKLYHFTHEGALAAILSEGLNQGDVPLSPTTGENAVWFTNEPTPIGHGIFSGGTFCATAEYSAWAASKGQHVPVGTMMWRVDKTKIRIRVDLDPDKTVGLLKWLDYAKEKHIDRNFLKRLHTQDGVDMKPNRWWLWFGTIPPELFTAIEVRRPHGGYGSVWENLELLSPDVRDALLAGEKQAA